MKKIILLIVFVILLTGCSAEVNIEVSGDSIEENISITATSTSMYSKDELFTFFRQYIPVYNSVILSDTEPDIRESGIKYYLRTFEELSNGYKFNYYGKFELEKYNDARSLKKGFISPIVQNDKIDNEIMLSTDNGGLMYFNDYPDLENVKINITSLCTVRANNADSVNGNVYTWNFDRSTKKGIYIVFDSLSCTEKEIVEPTVEKEENEVIKFANSNPVLVGILAFLGFVIVLFIIVKISNATKK